jgi:cytosine permease
LFDKYSLRVVSLYVPIVLIGWFGVEAAIFGNIVGEVLNIKAENRWVLMSGATLIFAFSCYFGFNAMRKLSTVLVPIVIIVPLYVVFSSYGNAGNQFGFSESVITYEVALHLVISSWIMGVLTCVPDIARYAKSPLSGAITLALATLFANSFTFLIGGYAAVIVGEADPAKILIGFGLIPLAILFALANIWSTNDNNMYSASINFARFSNLSRRKSVIICAILAAIFAGFDPTSINSLFAFLGFMGATAPALGGVVLGAYITKFFLNCPNIRVQSIYAWSGWIIGSIAASIIGGVYSILFGFLIGWAIWCVGLWIKIKD